MTPSFYANITLAGVTQQGVVALLQQFGTLAYVSPAVRGAVVVFHEDAASQEPLAAELSAKLKAPALLVMTFGESVLLYQLYQQGRCIDAYVSSPHDQLELDDAPQGDAAVLCDTFERGKALRSVERILRKPASETSDFRLAINRHGELARALGLPLIAAGTGYASIEVGELPLDSGADAQRLIQTPSTGNSERRT